MLHRDERDVDAGLASDLARPLPGTDHHLFASDAALVGDDGAHAPVLDLDFGDLHPFGNGDAVLTRALCQRHGDVGRRGLAVGREESRADDVVDLHQRPQLLRLLRSQEMHLEPEGRGGGRLSPYLGPALRVAGKPQAPVALPTGGEARLLLEPVIEFDGIAEQLGDVGARAQLSDQPRGVPGRAACQPPTLEQEHVGETHLPQVIGHRTADDAAAYDDDLGGRRQIAHARSIAWKVA